MCNDYLEKTYTCIQIFSEKPEDFELRNSHWSLPIVPNIVKADQIST